MFLDVVSRDASGGVVVELVALDSASGAEAGRKSVHQPPWGWAPGPFAGGGIVVALIDEGDDIWLIGWNAEDGSEQRRMSAAELATSPPAQLPAGIANKVRSVANTDTRGVIADLTSLQGIDRATGRPQWAAGVRFSDRSSVAVSRGAAAVSGDIVVVPAGGPAGPASVAIDARTGATLWTGPPVDHPRATGASSDAYTRREQPRRAGTLDLGDGTQQWAAGQPSYGELWALDDEIVVVTASDASATWVAYELAGGATNGGCARRVTRRARDLRFVYCCVWRSRCRRGSATKSSP